MVLKKTALAAGIVLATSQIAYANDLNINGFMSVGVGTSDSKVKINGMDNNASFSNDTVFGLQISKRLNDTTSATTQLVSRGQDGYNTEAAWAYITYEASDNTNVRMGRLRTPFFYYSDFLEVGYAYNWIRPVGEVYETLSPFSSINGIDVTHNFSMGRSDGSIQAYYGRYNGGFDPVGDYEYEFELKKFGGVVLNLTNGNFGTRLSYHQADVYMPEVAKLDLSTISPDSPRLDGLYAVAAGQGLADEFDVEGDTTQFYQAALTYDNGDVALIAEWTQLQHGTELFNDSTGYMASAAKRFGETTLHLTYALNEDDLASGNVGAVQNLNYSKDESIILGARFDYDAATTFKIEAQYTTLVNPVTLATTGTENSGMTYSAAVQLVF